MITATKKIICNKDYDYVLDHGVVHVSPFIFKNLDAILFRHGIDEYTKYYCNLNMLYGVEAGVPLRFLNSIKDSGYGYLYNSNTGYKDCIRFNFIQAIKASDNLSYRIRVKNVIILLNIQLILSGLILFLFVVHWFHWLATVLSKRLWK